MAEPFTEKDIEVVEAGLRSWFHSSVDGYAHKGHAATAEDCAHCYEAAEQAVRVLAETGRLQPPPDTDWYGNALDLSLSPIAAVVSMRRHGSVISFGLIGSVNVVTLKPEQADDIGMSLRAAAQMAREVLTDSKDKDSTDE